MKNVAVLAVVLGFLSGVAHAEESPALILAMSSSPAIVWSKPASTINHTDLAELVELKMAASAELISIGMAKQFEEKIAQELKYAIK